MMEVIRKPLPPIVQEYRDLLLSEMQGIHDKAIKKARPGREHIAHAEAKQACELLPQGACSIRTVPPAANIHNS